MTTIEMRWITLGDIIEAFAKLPRNLTLPIGLREPHSYRGDYMDLAFEIAYNAHDIDDGVRSGLLELEQLAQVPLFQRFHAQAHQEHPRLAQQGGRRLLYETLRRILSQQVYDVIDATRAALQRHAPELTANPAEWPEV